MTGPAKMGPITIGLLKIIRLVVDFISDIIFSILYGRHTPLPPLASPILSHSAIQLASMIRNRKLSSFDCVSAVIQRIKELDAVLTCVVDHRFQEALREAEEVDRYLAKLDAAELSSLSSSKPFLGVPFSCKDAIAVQGLKHTAGLYSRRIRKADEDAPVIARMKEAGGILVCVSNTSELCMWMESSNLVTGRTCNPYHTGRTVGGSSGGEGALIGGGATPVGIGSDIGGSIRIPCLFNGIFGHKPTPGYVPNEGDVSPAVGKHDYFLVTGPMCRDARDLMPMFKVLAGKNGVQDLGLNDPVNISDLTFYYMEDDTGSPLTSPVQPEIKAAQRNLIAGFKREFNVKVERVHITEFANAADMWFRNLASEKDAPRFSSELTGGKGEINHILELIKYPFNLSNHTLPALVYALMEKYRTPDSKGDQECLDLTDELKKKLNDLLKNNAVLIYPTHPTPAPYHNQLMLKMFNFAYCGIFNILGLPATQIPLGLGSLGVPLGVQVVGGANMDRLTLAVAVEAQRMHGGWVPPTNIL